MSCGDVTRDVTQDDRRRLMKDTPDGDKNPHFWRRVCIARYAVVAPTAEGARLKVEGWLEDEHLRYLRDKEQVRKDEKEDRARLGEEGYVRKAPNPWYEGTLQGLEFSKPTISRDGRWRVEIYKWIPK
jgi:hypothetical protein